MAGEPDGPVGAALVDREPHRAGDRSSRALPVHANGAPGAGGRARTGADVERCKPGPRLGGPRKGHPDRLGAGAVGEPVRDAMGPNAAALDARGADARPRRRGGRRWHHAGRPARRRSGPRADRGWRPCAAARWRRGADRRRDWPAAARRPPRRRARRSRRPARPRSRRRSRPARSPSIRPGAAHGSRSHHGRSRCLAMGAARRPHVAIARARPPIYRE